MIFWWMLPTSIFHTLMQILWVQEESSVKQGVKLHNNFRLFPLPFLGPRLYWKRSIYYILTISLDSSKSLHQSRIWLTVSVLLGSLYELVWTDVVVMPFKEITTIVPVDANILLWWGHLDSGALRYCESKIWESVLPFFCDSERDQKMLSSLKYSIQTWVVDRSFIMWV